MKRLRYIYLSLFLVATTALAEDADVLDRYQAPAWCHPNHVCLTDEQFGQVVLSLKIRKYRIRELEVTQRKWGGMVGCGPGVAASVIKNEIDVNSAIVCGLVFGRRVY